MASRIYVFANGKWHNDLLGFAIAEDGTVLVNHISSSEQWLAHDLGATSTRRHDRYSEHYPNGFVVEYVPFSDVETHAGLLAAVRANAAQAESEATHE